MNDRQVLNEKGIKTIMARYSSSNVLPPSSILQPESNFPISFLGRKERPAAPSAVLSSDSRDGCADLFGLFLEGNFRFHPFPSEDTREAKAEAEARAGIAASKAGAGNEALEAVAGIEALKAVAGISESKANVISDDGSCYRRGIFRCKSHFDKPKN